MAVLCCAVLCCAVLACWRCCAGSVRGVSRRGVEPNGMQRSLSLVAWALGAGRPAKGRSRCGLPCLPGTARRTLSCPHLLPACLPSLNPAPRPPHVCSVCGAHELHRAARGSRGAGALGRLRGAAPAGGAGGEPLGGPAGQGVPPPAPRLPSISRVPCLFCLWPTLWAGPCCLPGSWHRAAWSVCGGWFCAKGCRGCWPAAWRLGAWGLSGVQLARPSDTHVRDSRKQQPVL
jgi:hypothetical protein